MENLPKKCQYDVCWKGPCGKDVEEGKTFCNDHEDKKCSYDQKAVGDCHGFNGSFVCGMPLCDDGACYCKVAHMKH